MNPLTYVAHQRLAFGRGLCGCHRVWQGYYSPKTQRTALRLQYGSINPSEDHSRSSRLGAQSLSHSLALPSSPAQASRAATHHPSPQIPSFTHSSATFLRF
jgi:hypothetical protein